MTDNSELPHACVVGGSGFLGINVVKELLRRDYEVTVLDHVYPNISSPNVQFTQGSLLDRSAVDLALSGVDVVYNCAAIADLREAKVDPAATVETNAVGTIKLLERSIALGINRFVLASSVYASSRHGGFYRISKQAAEASVVELCRGSCTRYTILRYGSLYGPGAPTWNGIRRLVENAVNRRQLLYAGQPDTIREYIHIEDAARLSVDILGEEFEDSKLVITGLETRRVYDLLLLLGEILGLESKPEFSDQVDPDHYVQTPYSYEPSKARKIVPRSHIDLAQGLLEVISEIGDQR